MDFFIIHRSAFVLGLILIIAALLISAQRTKNYTGLLKFWEKRMEMNPIEFKIHRTGLVLMVAGVALSLLDQLL